MINKLPAVVQHQSNCCDDRLRNPTDTDPEHDSINLQPQLAADVYRVVDHQDRRRY